MSKKNPTIEMWRFVAAIMILMCHLYYTGVEDGYPFSMTFIFVEFFFMLTGYFSYVHLEKDRNKIKSIREKISYIFMYVSNKILKILPLAAIAIIFDYIIEYVYRRNENGVTFLGFWKQLPFDIMEVSDLYTEPRVVPLWYLSVELFILPVVCIIILLNKYLRLSIAIVVPVTYYSIFGVSNLRNFPYDYLRGLSAMLLGILIGEIVRSLRNRFLYCNKKRALDTSKRKVSITLSIYCIGNAFMLSTIVFAFFDLDIMVMSLLFFFIGLVLIFSVDVEVTERIRKVAYYLGALSIPIFIFQWVVGTSVLCLDRVVGYFNDVGLSPFLRSIIYIVGTIIVAILTKFISDSRLKNKRAKNVIV